MIERATFRVVLVAAILPLARTSAATPFAAPAFPKEFVGVPEFNTTGGKAAVGTASIVRLKGGARFYIVSARHLLGPIGAFDRQVAAEDVPAFVKSIRIVSFTGSTRNYHVTGLLVPANRLWPLGSEPVNDMAIFLIKDRVPQNRAMALAETVPGVGTHVWLVAGVRSGVPYGQLMHGGRVVSNRSWIVLQFDNEQIDSRGASGAPVLNASGEVIGVWSGRQHQAQGHRLGFAIPASLIAATIKVASSLERP